MPSRNNCHKSEAPQLAKAELMNKSCLASASAKEQLGVSSASPACNKSLNSSVTNGRVSTGLYCSDAGCLILSSVDKMTCPLTRLLP